MREKRTFTAIGFSQAPILKDDDGLSLMKNLKVSGNKVLWLTSRVCLRFLTLWPVGPSDGRVGWLVRLICRINLSSASLLQPKWLGTYITDPTHLYVTKEGTASLPCIRPRLTIWQLWNNFNEWADGQEIILRTIIFSFRIASLISMGLFIWI